MSFDWTCYLVLAKRLYNDANGEEAYLCSAISRAYYAAYVSARNHLRDKDGISSIPKFDAHSFVIDQFDFSPNLTRQNIGKSLG
jgi:hypothetical protein